MNAVDYSVCAAEEIKQQLQSVDPLQMGAFEDELMEAKRIFVAAAGRSLLAMKFFAMRLMQYEFTTFLVGEVCTPSIGNGDLLVIGSGSGSTPSMYAIAQKAKNAGARVVLVTLNPFGKICELADRVVIVGNRKIPEAALDYESCDSECFETVRPSGNIAEVSMVILLDAVTCRLMLHKKMSISTLKHNHANLE